MSLVLAAAVLAFVSVDVDSQRVDARFDPATGRAEVTSTLTVRGDGPLRARLRRGMSIDAARSTDADGRDQPLAPRRAADTFELDVPAGAVTVTLTCAGRLADDVASGEVAGQIHNFSVNAHVGADGIFMSDDAAWHPQPLDGDGRPQLHVVELSVTPMDGWALVASGDPVGAGAIDAPVWTWRTPRPVEGAAVAGNRHAVHGVVHPTPEGSVEVVMHVSPRNARLAPMFIDAARDYLDLYVPRLGPFPYRRFTIVENFFSSGFALPGFTVLGPRVVAMAPRSLAPGYLDHELLHNWWGNGVYVDPRDGNWCEGLTSYGANYWRRIADDGEDAGRAYRRSILMKLSSDPDLDDGPLGAFGSADPTVPGPDRFVGYEKGSFVFMMLEQAFDASAGRTGSELDRAGMWRALRRFSTENLGRRAGWQEIQVAFEHELDMPLDAFFRVWVREHTVPETPTSLDSTDMEAFAANYVLPSRAPLRSDDAGGIEIDPDFARYRRLPPAQLIPTLAGTLARGGTLLAGPDRPEMNALRASVETRADGENLLLIGAAAIEGHAALIARAGDPIRVTDGAFVVGGEWNDDPAGAVLHTMAHPDRPGRFVTVFHSNGPDGWSRLRLVPFYTRDTTIIWSGDRVAERRVFEPARTIR